jgi:hypothetical protein
VAIDGIGYDQSGSLYIYNSDSARYLYTITTNNPTNNEQFDHWIPFVQPNASINLVSPLLQADFNFVQRTWDLIDPALSLLYYPYQNLNQVTYRGWLLYFFHGGVPQTDTWLHVTININQAPMNGSPVYPIHDGLHGIRPSVRCC